MFALASAGMLLVTGFIIERIAPPWIILGVQGLLLIALVMLQGLSSVWMATLYAVTLGMASGMQSVASGVAWAHYYGRHGLGAVQGSATTLMLTGAALAPLPLALLQHHFGTYTVGLLLMGSIPLGGAILVLGLLRTRPVAASLA